MPARGGGAEPQEAWIVNTVISRPASVTDLDEIYGLLRQAGLPTQDLHDAAPARFWVADDRGAVVGAVALERHGAAGLLRSLVVAHGHRTRGIGTGLVAVVERQAREESLAQLVLLTETARSFFERLGYAVIARGAAPTAVQASTEFRALCPSSATCMIKRLTDRRVASPARVLFLCTGNSCRSILAEATFNHLAPADWRAMSAGSRPTGQVNPRSLALLSREGIAIDGCRSKSWNDLPQTPDIVITVCASAAGEACPAYLGPALRAHWGVDDPAHATGTDAEIDAQFIAAYRTLRHRIEAFLALPLRDLRDDPAALEAELDRIGALVPQGAPRVRTV